MSRISVKKSIREAFRVFSRRCEEWATDFAYRYRYDLFFRTKANVVALEFLFVVAVFAGLAVVSHTEYTGITGTLADSMAQTLSAIDAGEFLLTAAIFIVVATGFGLLIASIALRPTRDALASQKEFIGNVAHELRTPLSIVKTNIEVTLLEDKLNPAIRGTLSDNIDELNRTSDIINNLLSLNTLLNPERITFGNVDLGEVTRAAIGKLSRLAEQKRIRLTVHKGEFLIVSGNAAALEQIAHNLIKNALIYTRSGGEVAVEVAPDYRGYIRLHVTDNGIGIAQDDLLHVFEPFYRADRSRSREHGGSGLGLTIVSELVKLHQGKIMIRSTERKGTNVVVSLPCGAIPDASTRDDGRTQGHLSVDYSHHKHPAARRTSDDK